MKCSNEVVFKGVEEREGGVFTNDKGQEIAYKKAYVVRFDENDALGVSEKKVKFDGDKIDLYTKFKGLKVYDRITLIFNVVIQNSGCKITVLDFEKVK